MGIFLIIVGAFFAAGQAAKMALASKGQQGRGGAPAWMPYDYAPGFVAGHYRLAMVLAPTTGDVDDLTQGFVDEGFAVDLVYPPGTALPKDWHDTHPATSIRFQLSASGALPMRPALYAVLQQRSAEVLLYSFPSA